MTKTAASNDRGGSDIQVQTQSAIAVGDWVEFTLSDIPAGTYELALRFKHNTNGRGAVAVYADYDSDGDIPIGAVDEGVGGAASVYYASAIATVAFAGGGTHRVRFVVTRADNLNFDQSILHPVTP